MQEVNLIKCNGMYIPASNDDAKVLADEFKKNCISYNEMMIIQSTRPVNVISLNKLEFIDPT